MCYSPYGHHPIGTVKGDRFVFDNLYLVGSRGSLAIFIILALVIILVSLPYLWMRELVRYYKGIFREVRLAKYKKIGEDEEQGESIKIWLIGIVVFLSSIVILALLAKFVWGLWF